MLRPKTTHVPVAVDDDVLALGSPYLFRDCSKLFLSPFRIRSKVSHVHFRRVGKVEATDF